MVGPFQLTLIAAALVSLTALTAGCVGPTADQITVTLPNDGKHGALFGVDGAAFAPVSAVLERRCGNLDCHGSPFRALRIYGKNGLRRPETGPTAYIPAEEFPFYFSGGIPTTIAEIADNYDSTIALEPLLLQEVASGVLRANAEEPCPWYDISPLPALMTPECLTLVRKPLLIEKHKGGQIWVNKDPGRDCLYEWIAGPWGKPGVNYLDRCQEELALQK